ncbi:MAG: molybdenum cofactor biosynthesis protein MoaE [Opitutales bacterium]
MERFAFSLSAKPIDGSALRAAMFNEAAGAFCGFEGWVRDHNDDRAVLRLQYEAYEALALKQGQAIVEAAGAEFEIVAARAVHRMGELAIGDMAVWVGVTAAHRKAAFVACQAIIDRIKQDVPIWKKELYRDAPHRWIGSDK